MEKISKVTGLGFVVLLSASACSGTGVAAPAPGAAPAPQAVNAAAPAAAPDLVDHDLSTADPVWKGWKAKGPANAKVLQDGIHGARIAAGGMDGYDLAFSPAKTPLKDSKRGLVDAQKSGNVKITILTDTADELVWKVDYGSGAAFNFVRNYKVGGKDVSCMTNSGMGVSSEAVLATLKAGCATLTKQ